MGPLRYRDFRLLWSGLVLNGTASWVYQVTSGWLVYELTGSPLLLGLSSSFSAIPMIVVSLYGGALADRMDRRRLLLITQILTTLLAFVPALLSALGLIHAWHIFALNFLIHTVASFDGPPRQALIPSLVPRSELMRALALTSVIRRGTALIGPVIGGSAISMTGATGSFIVQAFLLVIVVLCTYFLRAPEAQLETRHRSMSRSVLDGLKYIYEDPFMFAMFGIEAMTMSFAMYVQILPVFARDVLKVGPTGLGFLYAAPGVGAVIASAAMLTIGDVKKKGRLFMVTALAKPVAAAIFALSTSMPLSLVMLGLVGLLDVAGGTARTTILQLCTAEKMLGRVMSMDLIIHRGLGTLNGIPLGAMASVVGAPFALAGGSLMVLVYIVSASIRVPSLHRYPED
jgi:MFS family permease